MTPAQIELAAHLVRTQLRERNSGLFTAETRKQQNTSSPKKHNSKNGSI